MSNIVKGIGKAISGVVKGIVNVVKGVVKAVVDVVSSVVNFIAQPFLGLLGGAPDIPDAAAESQRQQGVLITQQGSNINIPVIYGYRQVGGNIVYAETGADNNRYLWVAYVLSEGPVEGLRELFIDDNQLPAEVIPLLNNGQTVTVSNGKYKDRVQLQFSHGQYNATPSSSNVGTWSLMQDAPSWKSSMVYNGVATLFARYEWKKIETQEDADNNPFSGNIPRIKVGVLGRKVASLTDGSSPENFAYDSAPTTPYSYNPAEVLLDYLRNPRYGKGLKNSDIDWDSFRTAASKCAQTVTYINGVTGPIMTCNYVLDTGQTLFANTKNLLMGFRAYMPFSQGKYKLRIEDAGNPTDITSGVATIVATFNEDNIQGPVTYSAVERTSKYNQVQINYVDPDKKFSVESVIYPETDSERQTYIDKDGGRVNKLEATFPTITNYAIAKDFARLLFNKSRYQESVSFTASSQALELEVGDNIYIQSKMLNFGSTPFRVITMRVNNDMTVDLGCVRNEDSLYPHTRVGEEDVVLPPYIPKGATIDYPETVGGVPVGLVPPTSADVPVLHFPPRIFNISPDNVDSAGYTTITVNGDNFQTGITAKWIGTDGTEYTPDSAGGSDVTRNSSTQLTFETLPGMTDANQPYDLVVINSASFGSLTARVNNVLNVDGTTITPDTPTQDPPVTEDPDDPTITPNPTDPPPEGPGDNDTPPDGPGQPVTFDDFVEFTKVEYSVEGDLVYATITGTQPDRNDYKELIIYYKRAIATETVYQQMVVTTKPGANKSFSFRLGPLLKGRTQYDLISRVKYATGELSTRVNKIKLDASGATTAEDPRDYVEQASTGWPAAPGEAVKRRDTKIDKLVGQTLLTGGQPKDPKEIQITVRADVFNQPANYDVTGIVYYVKTSAGSQWTRYERAFATPYVPGVEQTFTLDIFGSPTYPSIPTSAQQNYDVIFRFAHKDGKESTEQWRIMGVATEYSALGSYDFNPFFGENIFKEKATAYDIELVDPSAPSAASSMTVALDSLTASLSGTKVWNFYIKPPEATVLADWRGIRVRYRPVVPGSDPDFETYESTSVSINGVTGLHYLPLYLEFDTEYEIVLTPMYTNAGVRTDSTESLFGTGFIHRKQTREDYPSTGNWLQSFNFKEMKTSLALKTIDEAFPAPVDPLVDITEWKIITPTSWKGANDPAAYYKLTFDHRALTDFSQLNVYRRSNSYGSVTDTYGTYYGIGRWEKVEITSVEASDSTTIFLRPPLHFEEYNPYFEIGGTKSLRRSFAEEAISGYGPRDTDEFLIVVEETGGEATIGWFLQGGNGSSTTQDLLQGLRPKEVTLADYAYFNSALEKNLSQAITRIAIADVKYNYRSSYSNIVATTTPAIE